MWRNKLFLLILFTVLFFAGDRVIGKILADFCLKSNFRYSCVYGGGANMEKSLLILGNSRGVNFLSAVELERSFGIPALNLSYNGMSMEIAESIFLDYIERKAPPKLVILEISNLNMDNDLIRDLKMFTPKSDRLSRLFKRHDPTGYYAAQLSNIFLFNCEMFMRAAYYMRRSDQSWMNTRTINAAVVDQARGMQPFDFEPPRGNNLDALARILEAAGKRGITVRLVLAPYLPEYSEKITNVPEWISLVQQKTGPASKVWNYSNAITEQNAFADRTHLNRRGAGMLLARLVSDGLLEKQ